MVYTNNIYQFEGKMAQIVTAKVFMNGRSQAIRLPKEFRVDTKEVLLTKEDGKIIVSPKKTNWQEFFDAFEGAPDFEIERDRAPPQKRDFFK
jgi:antitoxin VapB